MPGACADPWEAYGACGWSISLLWRWMDWIVRGDVILLGLMLVLVIGIEIHVSYRLSRWCRDSTDSRGRRQLAADLGVEVAVVRSIVGVAPYLGLVGACFGIMEAFRGIAMERGTALRLISLRVAVSLPTTALGILVAIAASCVHIYLSRRMGLLRSESVVEDLQTGRRFRLAPRFPLRKRFSGPPAYALIAAPVLACLVVIYEPFFDPHRPKGFAVDLTPIQCDVGERHILLHVTDTGRLFVNTEQEEWRNLSGRLVEIYRLRVDRTIDLLADDGVKYQTVMDAVDAVESAEMPDGERISVQLVTPKAMGGCPVPTVVPHFVAR
jgi:biopolymer transport protein ExbD